MKMKRQNPWIILMVVIVLLVIYAIVFRKALLMLNSPEVKAIPDIITDVPSMGFHCPLERETVKFEGNQNGTSTQWTAIVTCK